MANILEKIHNHTKTAHKHIKKHHKWYIAGALGGVALVKTAMLVVTGIGMLMAGKQTPSLANREGEAFQIISNAETSTAYYSQTGILDLGTGSEEISIENGLYRINTGERTSQTGLLYSGDEIQLMGTSSIDFNTLSMTTLYRSGQSIIFVIQTKSDTTTEENLSGESMSGEILTGEILSGEVLSGEILSGEVLTGEILTGEVLTGEIVSTGTNQTIQPLSAQPQSTGNILTGDTTTGTITTGTNLTGQLLSGDNLTGNNLTGNNLTWANLSGASFTGEITNEGTGVLQNFKSELQKYHACKQQLNLQEVKLTVNGSKHDIVVPEFNSRFLGNISAVFTNIIVQAIDSQHLDSETTEELLNDFNNFLVVLKLLRDDSTDCKHSLSNYYIQKFQNSLERYKVFGEKK